MSKSMEFIDTPFKVGGGKNIKSKKQSNALNDVGTGQIIWHLVKRHRFFLVSTYAVILTAVWVFPPLPYLVMALFGK